MVLLMSCAALMVGCSDEEDESEMVFELEGGEFHSAKGGALFDASSSPKDFLNTSDYVCWENGDQMNINGQQYTVVVDGNNDATIAASGVASIEGKYYAVFPASAQLAANVATFSLPKEEAYEVVNSGHGTGRQRLHALMAAATENSTMRFENLCALLELSVMQSGGEAAQLYAIEVSGNKQLCGEMTATFTSGHWSVNTSSLSGGTTRRLTFATPVTLNSTTQKFYLQLPPQTDVSSLTVRYYLLTASGEMKIYSRTKSSASSFSNAQIYEMGTAIFTGSEMTNYTLSGGTAEVPYVVTTSNGWTALMSTVQNSSAYVQLWNDITVGTATNTFNGHLDGNGHTITLDGNIALFKQLSGAEVSNLTVEGTVAEIPQYYINSRYCYGTLSTVANNTHFTNCTSRVAITSTIESIAAIGGINGWDDAGCVYENCHNYGQINVRSTHIGGIVGYTKARFEGCSNHADIVVNSTSTTARNVGGIAGNVNYSEASAVMVRDCSNSGNISLSVSNNSTNNVGGLLGTFNQSIYGCSNTGNVSTTGTSNVGGLVGKYTIGSGRTCVNCSSVGTISGNVVNAGGLIGCTSGSSAGMTIYNSYAIGNISGQSVAGIVGNNNANFSTTIANCYHYGDIQAANGGVRSGIVNCNNNIFVVNNCYYQHSDGLNIGSTSGRDNGTLNNATTLTGGGNLVDTLNAHLNSGWKSWVVSNGHVVHQ